MNNLWSKKRQKCHFCGSLKTTKRGCSRGVQTYFCKDCGARFSSARRKKNKSLKHLWQDYVFGKQTFREMNSDRRTVRKLFQKYQAPVKQHRPRLLHLVTDATYFGERTDESSWCMAVIRDPRSKEDLVWQFAATETTSLYVGLKEELLKHGYTLKKSLAFIAGCLARKNKRCLIRCF